MHGSDSDNSAGDRCHGGSVYRLDEGAAYAFREGCEILELLNTPASPAASVARARVGAGQRTRWHRLKDVQERYLVVAGRGRIELGERLRENVSPGDCVDIPAGVPQRIINTGSGVLEFLVICTPRFEISCYEDLETDDQSD